MRKRHARTTTRSLVLAFALLFGASQLTSCATADEHSRAIGGGAVGAVLGGLIGSQAGGKKGAVIGALSGALVGALIGHYFDNRVRSRDEAIRKIDYEKGGGDAIKLSEADLTPVQVKPGEQVKARVEYDVVTANPQQSVPVKETRVLYYQGNPVTDPIERTVSRTSGGYSSTYEFTIPEQAAKGEYTLATVLEAAGKQETAETKLVIKS